MEKPLNYPLQVPDYYSVDSVDLTDINLKLRHLIGMIIAAQFLANCNREDKECFYTFLEELELQLKSILKILEK